MIEFMDEIVEAVEQFIEEGTENLIDILGILAKLLILITAPVWMLPYKAIRAVMEWWAK